ncbi:MAG: PQQ-like beta-propeller repeat protein [Myxococcales bacterium]|nr:PQQ-like beta-propeller repeat protein [Myxococcales bacterium]
MPATPPNEPADAGPYDAGPTTEVLQHHNGGTRDGLYVEPAFTRAAVPGMHADSGFSATVNGHVYAQPLLVGGRLIVATESNEVSALDAATGAAVWRRTLGDPVPLSQLECGNIDPLGITGTPVADPVSRTVYLDAMTTGPRHLVFALSLDDGSTRPGWPVDVGAKVAGFNSLYQNQRGALALSNGILFVPYGGHFGDCGTYHGAIVAIPVAAPQSATAWQTRAEGGAVWGPSGIATDGTSIFAATGNTFGATSWADGEAVFRFSPASPLTPADQFHPSNWMALDDSDVDLGGSGVLLVHVPGATPADLAVALGKDGKAYLLERGHLGLLSSPAVSSGAIITAPASYTTANGTYVAFHGAPAGGCSGDLTVLKLSATSPPAATFAWCGQQNGRGSPIATTTDGRSDAVVWAVGTEGEFGSQGDERLHAFDGDTGAVLFTSAAMREVRRFQSPIVAGGRIYVAGDGMVYAFRP